MENQKKQQTGITIAEPLSPVEETSPLAGPPYSYETTITTTTTTTTTRSPSPRVSAKTSEVEQDNDEDTSMEDVSGENASEYDGDDDDDDDSAEVEDKDEDDDDSEDGEDESFTKDNRCLRCLKSCARSNRADHRRVHCLQGSEGVAVPEANKCTCCLYLGTQCIVAREPRRKGVNTIRCLRCISKGRSCSFKKTYRHMRARRLRFHPAKLAWSGGCFSVDNGIAPKE